MDLVCSICKSYSVTFVNVFNEQPVLQKMIRECFNFQADNKNCLKQMCKDCVSDVRAAYRFKRNFEKNVESRGKDINDIVNILPSEDWELITYFVKQERKESSEKEKNLKESKSQNEAIANTKRASDEEVAPKAKKRKMTPSAAANKSQRTQSEVERLISDLNVTNTRREETSMHCAICQNVFHSKRELTKHITTHHVHEERLKCPYCLKYFIYDKNFQKHLRIHSGEQELQCAHCPEKFTKKYDYLRHKLQQFCDRSKTQ